MLSIKAILALKNETNNKVGASKRRFLCSDLFKTVFIVTLGCPIVLYIIDIDL
jgi:hypothetical protein